MSMKTLIGAHRFDWVGGKDAGYAIFNKKGHELIRVWSEDQAVRVRTDEKFSEDWLVANSLQALVERGVMTPFEQT